MTAPQVSVLMLVFDHEAFVAQAIESVLAQKCDFDFDLIIINDCSADQSASVCRFFAEKYPSIIKFIDNPSNQGMHNSFETIWNESAADLVAFCEGDDFWIDDSKLQKQRDLMCQNLHWSLCGAIAQVIEINDVETWSPTGAIQPPVAKKEYSFEDMIGSYHFHFSTVMLRKRAVVFPDWFKSVYCVDRPIYLIAAQSGAAGYLNSIVSSYRIHSGGNWSSIDSMRKATQSSDLFLKLAGHFDQDFRQIFEVTLFNVLQTYVAVEMLAKRYDVARQIFWLAFSKLSFFNKVRFFKKYYRTAILLSVKR